MELDRADSSFWPRVVSRLLPTIEAVAHVLAAIVILMEGLFLWAWLVVVRIMERVLLSIVLSVVELGTVLPYLVHLPVVAVLIVLLVSLRGPLHLVSFLLGDWCVGLGLPPASSTGPGPRLLVLSEDIEARPATGSVVHFDGCLLCAVFSEVVLAHGSLICLILDLLAESRFLSVALGLAVLCATGGCVALLPELGIQLLVSVR